MAPKAMKRPAAAQAGPAHKKKSANADVAIEKSCNVVANAILLAELPDSVTNMLTAIARQSLGVAKEDRHPYQEEVIVMMGATLNSVEAAMSARIATKEGQVAEAGKEMASRVEAAEAAMAMAKAKAEATEVAKTEVTKSAATHKEAKGALAAAEAEQLAGNASLESALSMKTKLESALANTFMPIKIGTADPGQIKEGVAALLKLGKEAHFDESMLSSLPAAVSQAPDARGSFDTMVIAKIEEEINKRIAELNDELSKAEPTKAEFLAKVSAAQQQLESAARAETEAKTALMESQAAQKEADATQRTAAKTVKDFESDTKKVTADLEKEKAKLEELRAGALASYKALSERSNTPPPTEEKMEEAVPEETAPELSVS